MRRYLVLALTALLLSSCNAVYDIFPFLIPPEEIPDDTPTEIVLGSAKLVPFASRQEAADYFSRQVNQRDVSLGAFDEPLAAPAAPPFDAGDRTDATVGMGEGAAPGPTTTTDAGVSDDSADGSFSTTTTQEVGVDESDVVKTDGDNLYIITGDTLQIVRAAPPDQLALLSEVELEGSGREIYLDGDRIIAITATYGGYFAIDVAIAQRRDDGKPDVDRLSTPPPFGPGESEFIRPQLFVTIIDASDPSAPTILSQTSFDGSQSASRMIDGILHLVISNYESDFFNDVVRLGAPTDPTVSEIDLEAILPQYEQTRSAGAAAEGPVVTWEELYRPEDPNGYGVVSVVSMDVRNDAAFTAVGMIAEPGLIYSSLQALYLTDTEWDFFGNSRETTSIYKLQYVDGSAVPVAAGQVPGRILNQYSMGEHDGYLRVATTTGRGTESKNNVYVLDEVAGELEIVGRIEHIARGESIKSARFVGDRGFLVTFLERDPLFTLDLSNPTNPTVVGVLKVPGFSTFIVPIDQDHLLTVGQYIPEDPFFGSRGVQLSIFNIADFKNPVPQDLVVIGDEGGAYSEALNNPKAFTYFAEEGMVALPVSIFDFGRIEPGIVFEDDDGIRSGGTGVAESPPIPVGQGQTEGGGVTADPDETEEPIDAEEPPAIDETIDSSEPFVPQGFDGLYVYRVSADTGFSELGRLSTRFEDTHYFAGSFTRGVFIGNHVYAVSDVGVRAVPVEAMSAVPFEVVTSDASGIDTIDGIAFGGGVEAEPTGGEGTTVNAALSDEATTPAVIE